MRRTVPVDDLDDHDLVTVVARVDRDLGAEHGTPGERARDEHGREPDVAEFAAQGNYRRSRTDPGAQDGRKLPPSATQGQLGAGWSVNLAVSYLNGQTARNGPESAPLLLQP